MVYLKSTTSVFRMSHYGRRYHVHGHRSPPGPNFPRGIEGPLFHSQSVRKELVPVLVAAGALEHGRSSGGRGWPLELWASFENVVAVVPRRQNDLGLPHLRV